MTDHNDITHAIKQVINLLGEDIHRPGLIDTPKRVKNSLVELTSGYRLTPLDVIGDAIFSTESEGMIIQKGIEFYSLCEHHMLPFFGQAHVAYMPSDRIVGLSKIGRLIDVFSRRLQVQENLTHQIAASLQKMIKPKGVAVMIEASHFCMMMRGVQKQNGRTITTEFTGVFKEDQHIKKEFFSSIHS